jgi:SAM-dependent methyltransferase
MTTGARVRDMTIPERIRELSTGLEEIREFYEQMPYPSPVSRLDEHRELYADPQRRRALFHRTWPTEQPGKHQEILIAGCGTSQAARYALCEPDSHVTAIDISVRSLFYTRDLKRKYGLENLELQHLALENVRELDRTFDLIVCTGVLHHLPDPDRGLHALHDVLRPKGAMQLMVHATYGRAGIYMMQRFCRMLRTEASPDDLRNLNDLIDGLSPEHPMTRLLSRTEEFSQPQAMADALLHPRDRAFTVPELYAWLERAGMSFGRFIEQAPYLPQCGDLANSSYSERMNALSIPDQHAAAELFRGTMTQHHLIAYRDDYGGCGQSIHFTGQQWRDYVPIRLPWTLCIRDGVPPGSTAVLLNPAHKHRDLLLPLTWAQDHLLGAIDGARTLGDIVTACGTTKGAQRALQFFEQLYRYDQIVFDASRTVARTPLDHPEVPHSAAAPRGGQLSSDPHAEIPPPCSL